ncbi:MAG: hypothetical protein WBA00_03795 [Rhodococcus sp. (in: high G+C Gram-positive bacteria)]
MSTALDSRTASIARVHAQNWRIAFVWPVGILAVITVVTWGVLASASDGVDINSGGATFVFFFGMVFFAQGIAQFLPFTIGLGVTRREFFTATMWVAAGHALIYAVGLGLLSFVERATNGFGVGMHMFAIAARVAGDPLTEFGFFFGFTALCNVVGILFGAIYLRWRVVGMWSTGTVITLIIGASILLITWQGWWTALGTAVADTPRVVTMVILPVVAAAVAASATWSVMRRTEL